MKKLNKLIVKAFQTLPAGAMKQAQSRTVTAVRVTPGYTAHMLPPGSE